MFSVGICQRQSGRVVNVRLFKCSASSRLRLPRERVVGFVPEADTQGIHNRFEPAVRTEYGLVITAILIPEHITVVEKAHDPVTEAERGSEPVAVTEIVPVGSVLVPKGATVFIVDIADPIVERMNIAQHICALVQLYSDLYLSDADVGEGVVVRIHNDAGGIGLSGSDNVQTGNIRIRRAAVCTVFNVQTDLGVVAVFRKKYGCVPLPSGENVTEKQKIPDKTGIGTKGPLYYVSVSPNVMQHCMKTAFPPFKTAETLFVFPGGPGKL